MDYYQIVKKPLVTEKGTKKKEESNQIFFEVHRNANKIAVRKAIEDIFKVKVQDIRTMNMRGKMRRVGRQAGRRPDWKKAIVRLAPGENIEFFESV